MKKERPNNNTIKTRQVIAAEEQTYFPIAETTSTETEERTATILTATNSWGPKVKVKHVVDQFFSSCVNIKVSG